MTDRRDHDLLVVGGGPAGLSTALFLAAAAPHLRDRIAVIERRTHPREKICAGGVGGRADRALASIGVRVECPSAVLRGVSVTTPTGTLVCRREAPIGRVVRRAEFDAALANAARERGIRILEGERVTRLDRHDDHVRVHVEGQGSLTAEAVIGADGVGSIVRRELALGHGSLVAQAVEVDSAPSDSDPEGDLMHFDATDASLRGYAWDFPTIVRGERVRCRGVYELLPERGPDRERARGRELDVSARLCRYLDARAVSYAPSSFKRFAERGLALHEATAAERVLLVGEAAGIDPVLGEGIAQAVLYGQAAGPYLAGCIARRRFDFADWRVTLARSTVGIDLAVRTRLSRWIYGGGRPVAERFVARSQSFARAGIHYFAGDHVPRRALLRAAVALGRDAMGTR